MANWKLTGASSMRTNNLFPGHAPLPPRSPSPIAKPQYSHRDPNPSVGSSRPSSLHMPRSSSINFNIEEQPSWLEDLLSDPDSPVKNVTHRRSSSDPFVYLDTNTNIKHELKSSGNFLWGLQNQRAEGYHHSNLSNGPSTVSSNKQKVTSQEQEFNNNRNNLLWKYPHHSNSSNGDVHPNEDASSRISHGLTSQSQEGNMKPSCRAEAQSQFNTFVPTTESTYNEGTENCQNNSSVKLQDAKQVKQHNTRRSRVRKLQYIAELERRVQVMQAEGCGVSAELEYLNQHYLILVMENRALKQWFESLSQLQLVKTSERELLERELGRLQFLYQHQQQLHQQRQQQQQQKHSPLHKRAVSLDMESQYAKPKLTTQ